MTDRGYPLEYWRVSGKLEGFGSYGFRNYVLPTSLYELCFFFVDQVLLSDVFCALLNRYNTWVLSTGASQRCPQT
jgi:hypothetical protein